MAPSGEELLRPMLGLRVEHGVGDDPVNEHAQVPGPLAEDFAGEPCEARAQLRGDFM